MSFVQLPREIIGCIAEHLSDTDFLSLTSCSKYLRISATDNSFWRHRADHYQQWDPRRGPTTKTNIRNWLEVYKSRRKLEKHAKTILENVVYDAPWRHKHLFRFLKLGPEAEEYLEHLLSGRDERHDIHEMNDVLARRFFARAALTVLRRQKAVRYWKSIAPIMANETEPVSIDVLWKALNYSGYFFPFCYEEKTKPITCEKRFQTIRRMFLEENPTISASPRTDQVACILSFISGYSRMNCISVFGLSRDTTRREKYILFILLAHSIGLPLQSYHDWATIPGTLIYITGENGRYISLDLTSVEFEHPSPPATFFPDMDITRSLPDPNGHLKRTTGRLWLLSFLSTLAPRNSITDISEPLDDYLKYAQVWALFIFYGYDATDATNLINRRREAMSVVDYLKLVKWINFSTTFYELEFNKRVWFDFIHDYLAAGIDGFLYNLGTLTVFDTALYEIEGRSWLSRDIPRPRNNLLNRNIWMGNAGVNACGNAYDQSKILFQIGEVIYHERHHQNLVIVGIQPDAGVNTEEAGPFYITLNPSTDFALMRASSLIRCERYIDEDPPNFPLAGLFFKRWNHDRFVPLSEQEGREGRASVQFGRRVAPLEELRVVKFEVG